MGDKKLVNASKEEPKGKGNPGKNRDSVMSACPSVQLCDFSTIVPSIHDRGAEKMKLN